MSSARFTPSPLQVLRESHQSFSSADCDDALQVGEVGIKGQQVVAEATGLGQDDPVSQ